MRKTMLLLKSCLLVSYAFKSFGFNKPVSLIKDNCKDFKSTDLVALTSYAFKIFACMCFFCFYYVKTKKAQDYHPLGDHGFPKAAQAVCAALAAHRKQSRASPLHAIKIEDFKCMQGY